MGSDRAAAKTVQLTSPHDEAFVVGRFYKVDGVWHQAISVLPPTWEIDDVTATLQICSEECSQELDARCQSLAEQKAEASQQFQKWQQIWHQIVPQAKRLGAIQSRAFLNPESIRYLPWLEFENNEAAVFERSRIYFLRGGNIPDGLAVKVSRDPNGGTGEVCQLTGGVAEILDALPCGEADREKIMTSFLQGLINLNDEVAVGTTLVAPAVSVEGWHVDAEWAITSCSPWNFPSDYKFAAWADFLRVVG